MNNTKKPDLKLITDILAEIKQQEIDTDNTLHLTANENIMSKTASQFMSSNMAGRYHVATYDEQPGLLNSISHNIRDGLVLRCLNSVFALEEQARYYANSMFGASFCDFRPLSGLHGVFCTLSSVTEPGDNVYVFSHDSIAHYATQNLLKSIGRKPLIIPWDSEACTIDLQRFAEKVHYQKPKCIFLDIGTPLYPLPVDAVKQIVGDKVLMVYDASHILGLIAGGRFQNPLGEGCDILIGSTHKTFPGPVKGVIMYKNEEFGRNNSDKVFDVAVSSQHTHHALALYVTILEMAVYGEEYATQILKNNYAFATALEENGFDIFRKQNKLTETHLVGLNGPFSQTNHISADLLFKSNISTNSRKICEFNSIRTGVQEPSRRGMTENDMKTIAGFFKEIIIDKKNIQSKVIEFTKQFDTVDYSFDKLLTI